uniref:39S ribosomal protein L41, mitochondrial n=1 Tax=Parastrongyloides trichosuri TaxID=131310 RepID=A0A0N4ZV78_PARTI
MTSLIPYISTRGVRSLNAFHFKAPYFFYKNNSKGQRKIGPNYEEKSQWPGQNREFPELSPKFMKLNPEELHNYTAVKSTGYYDETKNQFITIKEMIPELIVPDLTNCELKPYVSFKTDVDIEERRKKYQKKINEYGSVELADLNTIEEERWPPPEMKAKTLFDLFYADEVKKNFKEGKYNKDI